jgi:branched-chain amino acid transport system substrate-binding protein
MIRETTASTFSRRDFLKLAGLSAGALALSLPRSSRALASWQAWDNVRGLPRDELLRVGVLLTRSNVYPEMDRRFWTGLKLYLARVANRAGGRAVELLPREAGPGIGKAVQGARELLETQGVDLVVGLIGSGAAVALRSLFEQAERPLLVSNVGANVLRQDEVSPYVVTNSLGHWRTSWALGRWAAQNLGQRGFIAESFYDAGYDAPYAFQLGFEGAGGTVLETRVSHVPPHSPDLASLAAAIRAADPDFVYAAYCGAEAREFARAYADAGLAGRVPLVGSALVAEEALGVVPAIEVRAGASWVPGLDNEENRAFSGTYRRLVGRSPGFFDVLGYDAARLVVDAVNAVQGDVGSSGPLLDALGAARFDGPRGLTQVRAGQVVAPTYALSVHRSWGRLVYRADGVLPADAEADQRVRVLQDSLKTGWLNAYLGV